MASGAPAGLAAPAAAAADAALVTLQQVPERDTRSCRRAWRRLSWTELSTTAFFSDKSICKSEVQVSSSNRCPDTCYVLPRSVDVQHM